MSALHKLAMAFVTIVGGMEVVVLDAVPSPVRSDLQTAEAVTIGGLAVGLGVAFALATAFSAGQSGPRHRHDDNVAAPNGIPPWDDDDDDFVWDGTFTPEAKAEIREGLRRNASLYAPAAVTEVDMDPVAETREIATDDRSRRIAAAWASWDATGEQPAKPDDTQLMLPVGDDEPEPVIDDDSELLVPWTPPVAPNAPWSDTGLAFMRVEVCEAYDKRHAVARAEDPGDWFGMAAERQERAA